MSIAILRHTPVWVWLLFAALIGLGLSKARPREASLGQVTVLPVTLVSFSIVGVLSAFGPSLLALGSWSAGLVLAMLAGRHAVAARGVQWSAATGRLRIPGSWLPMALIVALFVAKYAAGVAIALHPERASDPVYASGFSLAYGFFSGLFVARVRSIRAVAGRRAAWQPA